MNFGTLFGLTENKVGKLMQWYKWITVTIMYFVVHMVSAPLLTTLYAVVWKDFSQNLQTHGLENFGQVDVLETLH